jgi:hypothetical protein
MFSRVGKKPPAIPIGQSPESSRPGRLPLRKNIPLQATAAFSGIGVLDALGQAACSGSVPLWWAATVLGVCWIPTAGVAAWQRGFDHYEWGSAHASERSEHRALARAVEVVLSWKGKPRPKLEEMIQAEYAFSSPLAAERLGQIQEQAGEALEIRDIKPDHNGITHVTLRAPPELLAATVALMWKGPPLPNAADGRRQVSVIAGMDLALADDADQRKQDEAELAGLRAELGRRL